MIYLLSSSVFSQLESDPLVDPVLIRSLQMIPDADVLEVDSVTLRNLGVFVGEAHPASGRVSKEGVSLFSCINNTKTSMGSRMLKSWLTYPSTNIDVITNRHAHINYFIEPGNAVSA